MRRSNLDALTARESEVLDLIRRGLTNEEIAHRLDISLHGAKYHVSQILSKLGVATREEAALAVSKPRRWWAEWPLWAKVAGATTFVAIAAGLAALAWAAFGRGDGEEIAAVAPGAGSGSSVRNSVPADDQVTCPPIGNTAGIGGGVGLGWLAPGVACWTDRSDESEYRVEGSIIYWACDETGYAGRSENIPFSVSLPSDSTQFRLPDSPDPRFTKKHFSFAVSAILADPRGLVLDHTSGRDDPCPVIPYEPSVIGSYKDVNGFQTFAAELDSAIQRADIQWFMKNTRFEDFRCDQSGFAARPRACGESFNPAIIPAVTIGLIGSEGYGADRSEYEDFLRAYLIDIDESAVDRFGDGAARLYSFGVHAPYVWQDPDQVEALVTSIPREVPSGTEYVQSLRRNIFEFHIKFEGGRWIIDSLSRGVDNATIAFDLDPAGGAWQTGWGGPLWGFWQRWEASPTP